MSAGPAQLNPVWHSSIVPVDPRTPHEYSYADHLRNTAYVAGARDHGGDVARAIGLEHQTPKLAFDAGCAAALHDLGLTKTALSFAPVQNAARQVGTGVANVGRRLWGGAKTTGKVLGYGALGLGSLGLAGAGMALNAGHGGH